MQDAQCRNALDRIRTHLFINSALTTFKERHVRGQRDYIRSRKTLSDNDHKIKICSTRHAQHVGLGANPEEMEWKEIKGAGSKYLEDEEMTEEKEAQRARGFRVKQY